MTNLGILILVVTIIIMVRVGAVETPRYCDSPPIKDNFGPVYPLFLYTTTLMAPSYLSGNSDFNPEPQETLYLQKTTTIDQRQTNVGTLQVASTRTSKIPSWLIMGFLIIDIPICLILLYLALTKKI